MEAVETMDTVDTVDVAVDTEADKKNWYALQVTTGYENKAYEFLKERIESSSLQNKFGQVLIPTEKRLEFRRGVKKEIEEKMFPGYLFVEIMTEPNKPMDADCWHLVRKTRWINGFIGGAPDAPRPLSEPEVEAILKQIGDKDSPTLRSRFVVGGQVHIKDGPFDDFSGTVQSVNNERERLTVAVMVFGRSTPVELDFSQVEKE